MRRTKQIFILGFLAMLAMLPVVKAQETTWIEAHFVDPANNIKNWTGSIAGWLSWQHWFDGRYVHNVDLTGDDDDFDNDTFPNKYDSDKDGDSVEDTFGFDTQWPRPSTSPNTTGDPGSGGGGGTPIEPIPLDWLGKPDHDGDGLGDWCDSDMDGDGLLNWDDPTPDGWNHDYPQDEGSLFIRAYVYPWLRLIFYFGIIIAIVVFVVMKAFYSGKPRYNKRR